jgi:hypothetical protein
MELRSGGTLRLRSFTLAQLRALADCAGCTFLSLDKRLAYGKGYERSEWGLRPSTPRGLPRTVRLADKARLKGFAYRYASILAA